MIVHSFDELEGTLNKELKSIFPNVYAIGPLQLHMNQITEKETVNLNFNGYSLWKEEPECIQWLQSKEANSVVYVNFGSLAVMSLQDLLEFGWGLVNSNHYFLWIIRADSVDGKPVVFPQELEEVIKGKGFIASWCSQEEVLNHPSVGGFLTHGGWGSVIESLSAGVPMVCWLFAHDQRVNCRQMCKEWEIGMEIEGSLKRDVVEKLVRELIKGLEGKRIRKNTMEWKKTAKTRQALMAHLL
ncbi:UDP-glycosyltransferase 85C1-like protein [Tanacetum coccineum]